MRKLIGSIVIVGALVGFVLPAWASECPANTTCISVARLHIGQRNHAWAPKTQSVGVHVTNDSRAIVSLAVTYQRSGISTQPRTVLGGVSVYPGQSFDATVTVPRWRYTDGLVTALVDRAEDGLVVTLIKLGPISFKNDPRKR